MLLNLARRPFVNRKPVRRIGAILLSLGVGLAIVNGYLYWQHWTGQGVAASGLEGVSRELEEERERLQRAFAGFADFDPRDLNGKIEFVNHRILQRTFSWSRLFDDVSDAMPTDVRLLSLAPQFDERRTRRRGRAARMSSREQERS